MTYPMSHSSSVWEGGPEPKSLTPRPPPASSRRVSLQGSLAISPTLTQCPPSPPSTVQLATRYCLLGSICAVPRHLPLESGPHTAWGCPWFHARPGRKAVHREDTQMSDGDSFPAGICWLLQGRGGQYRVPRQLGGALNADVISPPRSTEPLRSLPGPPACWPDGMRPMRPGHRHGRARALPDGGAAGTRSISGILVGFLVSRTGPCLQGPFYSHRAPISFYCICNLMFIFFQCMTRHPMGVSVCVSVTLSVDPSPFLFPTGLPAVGHIPHSRIHEK